MVLITTMMFAAAISIVDRGGPPRTTWSSADGRQSLYATGERPTPAPSSSSQPLGRPADPSATGGTHAFVRTQPGTSDPVAYDPCRKIEIHIDERTAPKGGRAIIDRAIAKVEQVTGLTLEIKGETTERASSDRAAYQPDRFGDRWAPVLLAWSDEDRTPALAGDVAGIGGSTALKTTDGPLVYVSGLVALDAPDLRHILAEEQGGSQIVEDIVLHELGHLVGLDHVDSTDELMHPEGQPELHGFQRGDLTGLTRLGQGPCISRL